VTRLILINAAVGGCVCLAGVLLVNFTGMHDLGGVLANTGLGYAVLSISFFVVPLYKFAAPRVQEALLDRAKSKAYKDLLRYKALLDQNIISKQEFEAKSRELKAKLL